MVVTPGSEGFALTEHLVNEEFDVVEDESIPVTMAELNRLQDMIKNYHCPMQPEMINKVATVSACGGVFLTVMAAFAAVTHHYQGLVAGILWFTMAVLILATAGIWLIIGLLASRMDMELTTETIDMHMSKAERAMKTLCDRRRKQLREGLIPEDTPGVN